MLHRVVREHLESLLAECAARSATGCGYPAHVEAEFRRYLDCGLLANGFLRVHCDACNTDELVAFSCKGRGLCPSCIGRRMSELAARLSGGSPEPRNDQDHDRLRAVAVDWHPEETTMEIRRVSTAFVLLAVFACGGNGDGAQDAAVFDATPTDDATPFAFVSADPVDGASPVSVWTKMTVVFASEVNAANLDPSAITVTEWGYELRGPVQVGTDGNSLVFTPSKPVRYNTPYEWSVGAIEGADGRNSQPMTLSFTTYLNPLTRNTTYDAGGQVTGWTGYFTLVDIPITATYVGAGVDGVWPTADDEVSTDTASELDAEARTTRRAVLVGAGPDATWFTLDDVPSGYNTYEYDAVSGRLAREVRYNGAGTDGLWFTADDNATLHLDKTYDMDGNTDTELAYNQPGPDGIWLTADDVAYSGCEQDWQGGMYVSRTCARDPGLDGVWFTGDDEINAVEVHTYEGAELVRFTTFDGPGVDTTWHTADDDVLSYRTYTHSANNLLVRQVSYSEAGVDGLWFTADDVVSSHHTYTYNAGG